MTTQSTTKEATGEECCKNHSNLCNSITGCACGNCSNNKPQEVAGEECDCTLEGICQRCYKQSSEPSQECKHEFIHPLDKWYCRFCMIDKPTEVPQEEWEEELWSIIKSWAKNGVVNTPANLDYDLRALFRQAISQAEQKGYERGINHCSKCK